MTTANGRTAQAPTSTRARTSWRSKSLAVPWAARLANFEDASPLCIIESLRKPGRGATPKMGWRICCALVKDQRRDRQWAERRSACRIGFPPCGKALRASSSEPRSREHIVTLLQLGGSPLVIASLGESITRRTRRRSGGRSSSETDQLDILVGSDNEHVATSVCRHGHAL